MCPLFLELVWSKVLHASLTSVSFFKKAYTSFRLKTNDNILIDNNNYIVELTFKKSSKVILEEKSIL